MTDKERDPLFTYPFETGDSVDEWSLDNDYEAGLANRAFEIGFNAGLERAAEIAEFINDVNVSKVCAKKIRQEKKPTGWAK